MKPPGSCLIRSLCAPCCRCEAKVALPRGGTHPNRTTRIFVARIPPTVQDAQFRSYFEQFGRVQDAYMPKDAFKQAHRGIGFVTYATAEPVEQVGLPVGMLAEEGYCRVKEH